MCKLKISGLVKESIVDGPGIRYTVFTQGCNHKCKGCHNADTHNTDGGVELDTDDILKDILSRRYLDGVTISGGEPFLQAKACYELAKELKKNDMHLIGYTGYTFEQLLEIADEDQLGLLNQLDLLVDGPYVESKRDLKLQFRGSENQRILDVKQSMALQKAVEASDIRLKKRKLVMCS